MKKREREALWEDLLASMSPAYLKSIREARADWRVGRVKAQADIFGGGNRARFKT